MPWKTMDVQEQRVRFVVAAHRREKTMVASVPGVRHLAAGGLRVVEALSSGRSGGHRGTQPASAEESAAN